MFIIVITIRFFVADDVEHVGMTEKYLLDVFAFICGVSGRLYLPPTVFSSHS